MKRSENTERETGWTELDWKLTLFNAFRPAYNQHLAPFLLSKTSWVSPPAGKLRDLRFHRSVVTSMMKCTVVHSVIVHQCLVSTGLESQAKKKDKEQAKMEPN